MSVESEVERLQADNAELHQLLVTSQEQVAQLAQHPDVSRAAFDEAITRLQAQDDRATVSASRYAASGASLLTNDNARPYDGRTYERVFVHQYQALNYLAAGDEQGALVEVRRANQVQVDALHAKENQVDSARQEAESKGFDANRYNGYFNSMDLAAGRVKSGFQNAATFYLSGLIYEATGAVNDAFIDYRKALELVPDNPYLQRDVVRTGQKTGLDEIRTLARALGPVQVAPHKDEGELVIYLEEGYVPSKVPVSIPIWTSKTVNNVSFPAYNDSTPPRLLTVQVDGQSLFEGAGIHGAVALASSGAGQGSVRDLARQHVLEHVRRFFFANATHELRGLKLCEVRAETHP